jgi:catalase
MFSYPDSQRYRLGPNYQQLPPNRPVVPVYSPYERDGPGRIDGNYRGDPNYVRSATRPVALSARHQFPLHEQWQGSVTARSTNLVDHDFEQPRELWKIMQRDGAADQFLDNIRPMLKGVKKELREQVFGKETHPPSRRVDNLFV